MQTNLAGISKLKFQPNYCNVIIFTSIMMLSLAKDVIPYDP